MNIFAKLMTRNGRDIPLFSLFFDWQKYQKDGEKDSCTVCFNYEVLSKDEVLLEKIGVVVDHIRSNYDMEQFYTYLVKD